MLSLIMIIVILAATVLFVVVALICLYRDTDTMVVVFSLIKIISHSYNYFAATRYSQR